MSDDSKKDEPNLDRRGFFRMGARKTAKTVIDMADKRAQERAKHFVRPPFAVPELEFLLKCTRCNDCITACPHDTVFSLTARLGVEVMATPALDLTHKACHLCADWPCITACKTGALALPLDDKDQQDEQTEEQSAPLPLPKLALAKIDQTSCLPFSGPECGACGSVCPVPNAIEWDMTRPKINPAVCTGCALCRQSCITSPKSIKMITL